MNEKQQRAKAATMAKTKAQMQETKGTRQRLQSRGQGAEAGETKGAQTKKIVGAWRQDTRTNIRQSIPHKADDA